MDQKNKQQDQRRQKQVNDVVTALGGIAEMSHVFYTSMIDAGATSREATAAMNDFIAAFWNEQMEDARRKKGGQNNEQE